MVTLLQERMERSTKLLNQVFKGINKILPKIKPTPALTQFLEENLDSFFRFCHVSTSRISIQILLFLFQILKTDLYSKVAERYLTLLYGFLDSPKVYESRLLEQFFDLMYTIVTSDFSTDRICAFFKRLFMTTLHCETRVVVATLVFFARVVQEKPAVGVLLKNPHQGIQDDVQDEDAENEQYHDAELSDGERTAPKKNGVQASGKNESKTHQSSCYDPQKRNPLYTNAGKAGLPEVECLKGHYNPAVRKIATLISKGEFGQIDYKGNPFEDFTNIAILNRIALMQPKKRTESPRTLQKRAGRKLRLEPISLGNYQDLQFEDEKAIQLYFQKRMETFGEVAKKQKRRRPAVGDEEDAFADELIEREMEKYGGREEGDDEIIPEDDGEENGEGEDFESADEEEEQDDEGDDDDVPEFDSEVEDVPSDEEEEEEEAPRRPLLSKRPPKASQKIDQALNKRRKVR
jgi:ribosome biogenesis protein MAK21